MMHSASYEDLNPYRAEWALSASESALLDRAVAIRELLSKRIRATAEMRDNAQTTQQKIRAQARIIRMYRAMDTCDGIVADLRNQFGLAPEIDD